MSHEQPASHKTPPRDAAVQTEETLGYEPAEQREEWIEEPLELPRRPRRGLLGVRGNPIPLALLGVLLIACGFIAGVLVEKGQSSATSSTSSGGLGSRLATLRSGGTGGAGFGRGAAGGSGAGAFAGGALAAGATVGQVAYVSGHTLYVTNSEGNTVKVITSAGSAVTKTVTSSVNGIHPGETVIVTGSAGAGGAISAETIRVSESGSGAALGGLFGGPSRSPGGAGARSSGGEPALFGM